VPCVLDPALYYVAGFPVSCPNDSGMGVVASQASWW
jgi:hypothetical protein